MDHFYSFINLFSSKGALIPASVFIGILYIYFRNYLVINGCEELVHKEDHMPRYTCKNINCKFVVTKKKVFPRTEQQLLESFKSSKENFLLSKKIMSLSMFCIKLFWLWVFFVLYVFQIIILKIFFSFFSLKIKIPSSNTRVIENVFNDVGCFNVSKVNITNAEMFTNRKIREVNEKQKKMTFFYLANLFIISLYHSTKINDLIYKFGELNSFYEPSAFLKANAGSGGVWKWRVIEPNARRLFRGSILRSPLFAG